MAARFRLRLELWALISLFFTVNLAKIYNMEYFEKNLQKEPMGNNISKCTNHRIADIRPEHIHIIVMGSSEFLKGYVFQVQTIKAYAKLHGYNLHFKDVQPIIDMYGAMPSDRKYNTPSIISSKTLLIYCNVIQFGLCFH